MNPQISSATGTACRSYSSFRRQINAQVAADMQLIVGSCNAVEESPDIDCEATCLLTEGLPDVEMIKTDIMMLDDNQEFVEPELLNMDAGNIHHEIIMDDFQSLPLDSDDSDECNPDISQPPLDTQLAQWVNKCKIPHDAVGDLLRILKPYHPSLPLNSKTLLKTPNSFKVKKLRAGGEYCHSGIASGILELCKDKSLPPDRCLELQFNIDGLPLFKSSNVSLWPILCLIKQVTSSGPYVVGLYSGATKPNDVTEYLSEFVDEALSLVKNGIVIENDHYDVKIHSFVCDAPARAFLKCIKSHSGYSACEKCTQIGEYSGKVIFPSTSASLRTDEDFEKMLDDDHHISLSPLSVLPIGMVSQFGLDYMHLVCLGVVKRLLLYWKGPIGPLHVRLGRQSILQLSTKLLHVKEYVPREFARRPRAFTELPRWKATEFRQFLLYTGPIILSGILPEPLYRHFLLLSVAIIILASPRFVPDFIDYANELLVLFVKQAETLYGKEILVYNVHCLIHLAGDVRKLGCLDTFSAFPFENKLGQLKKLVRKPQFPIQQVLRRLAEANHVRKVSVHTLPETVFKKEHNSGPVLTEFQSARQYKQVTTNQWFFAVTSGDNCFRSNSGSFVIIRNILTSSNDSVILICEKFAEVIDAFDYPLPSSSLGICKVSNKMSDTCSFLLSDVAQKCACLPVNETLASFIVFPLLHN